MLPGEEGGTPGTLWMTEFGAWPRTLLEFSAYWTRRHPQDHEGSHISGNCRLYTELRRVSLYYKRRVALIVGCNERMYLTVPSSRDYA